MVIRTGIGRELALAALKRGDKVIATARQQSLPKVDDPKAQGADVVGLDVTAPLGVLHDIAKEAVNIHGRVDVIVNNAGGCIRLPQIGWCFIFVDYDRVCRGWSDRRDYVSVRTTSVVWKIH